MKVVIMRGVPGSGKSYFAKSILPRIYDIDPELSVICSADNFFTGLDGVYRFDPSKLGEAHLDCRYAFFDELNPANEKHNYPKLIVVDNTNTLPTEIAFYYDLATLFTKDVEILTITPPPTMEDKEWLEQCFKYNQHGVPLANIQSMNDRIKKNKLPWHWNERMVIRGDGYFTLGAEKYDTNG